MKKSFLIVGLTVCGLTLTNVGTSQAATTEGSINFTKTTDNTGSIVKPEEPGKEIIPETGGQSSGDLRIQHVPDFNFGTREIEIGEQTFHPTLEKYLFDKPVGNEVGAKYLPHFIQVTDVRGKKQGWNLRVAATVFETVDGDELPNARITLKEAKLSNDVYNNLEIASKVKTFANDPSLGNILEIPTDAAQAKVVMSTRGVDQATTTDGSRTSIVLDNGYDKDKLDYLATDTNSQVVLKKTNKDVPVISEEGQTNKEYKSTVTWTLTDGI